MILQDLQQDLIKYQKAKDSLRIDVIRFLMAGIKNKEIELRGQNIVLNDEHIVKVINKQIKQRNDSIESYKMGNREDLVQKETKEKEILEEILSKYNLNV
ncbi:hypothetical protein A2V49_00405 [candidate division WWE3 bacterium RBG_19FT_COMBO_34_6]|uniref:Uncharacterized protein n=1 Tax=candidate division WWE3 bacterium RBG_19FT_COMBO_34_6 TaxID=1802612 RepID=A0A1F4UMU6_UNCKA|nr:MAG: hypothetical protein A2V49_00405 [candidate division WWE3 bacterium RBG_19FT_COMBO_34_6]